MLTQIYIHGNLLSDGSFQVPLSSSAILFVVQYCEPSLFEIIFVDSSEDDKELYVSLGSGSLTNIKQRFSTDMTEMDIPDLIKNCLLPAVYDGTDSMIRCGLCCIVRHVVKVSHQYNPGRAFLDLLGFRGGSLKACAEVSSWTKLCEVESPESMANLIHKLRKLKSGTTDTITIPLPQDLMRLERHLKKPTRPHNDDKRKRAFINQIRKEVTDLKNSHIDSDSATMSFPLQRDINCAHGILQYQLYNFESTQNSSEEMQENQDFDAREQICGLSEVVAYMNRMTLEDVDFVHLYFEGVSVTVADLILFTFTFHFLEALHFDLSAVNVYLPSIVRWMGHMLTLSQVRQAAMKCQFVIDSLTSNPGFNGGEYNNLHRLGSSGVVFDLGTNSDTSLAEEEALNRVSKNRHHVIRPEIKQALQKIQVAGVKPNIGVHPRGTNVQISWDELPAGAHPGDELPKKRVARKCQQLENLVTAVEKVSKPGNIVVDFCSGGGHLGLVLAYRMPQCKVYLVENKEESLLRAKKRVDKLKLTNITFYQCNLDYFYGKFDVGVCLHACGVATDLVLQQCINSNAAFVICPCCYGNIENTHLLTYPRSQLFTSAGINSMDFLALGHAADQTELNIALEEQGRLCMNLVDSDRGALAREAGYSVALCSLQPLTCTTKNNLLIGTPRQSIPNGT